MAEDESARVTPTRPVPPPKPKMFAPPPSTSLVSFEEAEKREVARVEKREGEEEMERGERKAEGGDGESDGGGESVGAIPGERRVRLT